MINLNKRLICLLILLYLPATSIYKRYSFNVNYEKPLAEALSRGNSRDTALGLENIANYMEQSNLHLENTSYYQNLTDSAKELKQLKQNNSPTSKLITELRQSSIDPKGNLEIPSSIVGHYIWGFSPEFNQVLQGISIISLAFASIAFAMGENESYLDDEDLERL